MVHNINILNVLHRQFIGIFNLFSLFFLVPRKIYNNPQLPGMMLSFAVRKTFIVLETLNQNHLMNQTLKSYVQ